MPPSALKNFWPPVCVDKLGGLLPVFILILGTGIEVIAIGYIGFLWGPDFRDSTLWRRIIVDGWFLGSVTLTALVIRLASSSQAVLCTSMLASLLLERHHVSLKSVCAVSILRFINTGPHTLLRYGFSFLTPSSLFRPESLLTLFLTIATLLLQFTSTVLLRDTGLMLVAGFEHVETAGIGYGSEFTRTTYGANYWAEKPLNYFLFAEYLPEITVRNNSEISDSGPRQRAFLPFPMSGNRSSIRDIKGDMVVIDNRNLCIRPQNMTLRLGVNDFDPETGAPRHLLLSIDSYGKFDQADPDLDLDEWPPLKVEFACFLPMENPESIDPSDEIIGVCVGYVLRSLQDKLKQHIYGLTMFTIGGDWDAWRNYRNNLAAGLGDVQTPEAGTFLQLNESLFKPDGPWLRLDTGQKEGVQLSLTTCFTGLKFDVQYVEAYASRPLTENTVTWSQADGRYNTERVRNQVAEPRGVSPDLSSNFVMKKPPAPERNKGDWHMSWIKAAIESGQTTMTFCLNCTLGLSAGTNRVHTTLMQDLHANGAGPATICLVTLTLLLQMAYYDRMVEYTNTRPFEVTRFVEALAPRRTIGFIAVAGVMAAHVLLVIGIAFGFLGWTRASKIGGAWLAIGQVHKSEEFGEVLEGASLLSDGKVVRALGAYGRRKVSLRVVPNQPFVEHEAKFTVGLEEENVAMHMEKSGEEERGSRRKLIKRRRVPEGRGEEYGFVESRSDVYVQESAHASGWTSTQSWQAYS